MKEFYCLPFHTKEEEHNTLDNKFCEGQRFRNWVNISALATWKWSESEVTQSCPMLCDPMDCSPPGSSIHGIFQARGLEWSATAFSRGYSGPSDQTQVSHIVGRLYHLSHCYLNVRVFLFFAFKSILTNEQWSDHHYRGTVNNPVPS